MTAKVSDIIEALKRDYRPDDVVAYAVWTTGDVRTCMTSIMDLPDCALSDADVAEVLDRVDEETEGQITFEAIEDAVDELLDERGDGGDLLGDALFPLHPEGELDGVDETREDA